MSLVFAMTQMWPPPRKSTTC